MLAGLSSLQTFVPDLEQDWSTISPKIAMDRIPRVLRVAGPSQALLPMAHRRVLDYSSSDSLKFLDLDESGAPLAQPKSLPHFVVLQSHSHSF